MMREYDYRHDSYDDNHEYDEKDYGDKKKDCGCTTCGRGKDHYEERYEDSHESKCSNHKCSKDKKKEMCNGVFSPVCCPGVCNVPRMKNKITIVKGYGTFESDEPEPEPGPGPEPGPDPGPEPGPGPEPEGNIEAEFKLHIYKEFGKCKGELLLVDYKNTRQIYSEDLKCFEHDKMGKLVALFKVTPMTGSAYYLTVTAHPKMCACAAEFFAYAAPECGSEGVNLGGALITGEIVFFTEKEDH